MARIGFAPCLAAAPLLLAGCASSGSTGTDEDAAITARAFFRTWLIPRTFDTARIFRFYSLLPERPAELSAERVSSTQMDYLVLKYDQGSVERETIQPFTAILEWEPRRVLEAGILEMYINGDGSGVEMFVNGEDAEGAGFVYNIGAVDWQGWREVKIALDYPDEFYGEKADSKRVAPPLTVDFVGIRDKRNRGSFQIVLAETCIVFPKERPDQQNQLSEEEREAIKRSSTVGIATTDQDNLPVQRPVETKMRRQRF